MNKAIKTILIISIAIFGVGFLFLPSANAQVDELVVEYWTGTDWDLLIGPIFSETNFLPGQSVNRLVKVTNNSGQPQRIATEAINYPKPVSEYDLSRVLILVIKQNATELYGGSSPTGPKSLYDFYQDSETYSEIYLSDLANKETTQYEFAISFLSETEKKEWQDATTSFDILIGFQGAAGGVPPGWGGGGVLPPGLTIRYEKDIYLTGTTATIEWDTNYEATSQVIYDTVSGQFDLSAGPSNYGYAFSKERDDVFDLGKGKMHRVTLTGLTENTTYYYRAVSHASLAISEERSFTTLGAEEIEGIGEEGEGKEEAAGEEVPVTEISLDELFGKDREEEAEKEETVKEEETAKEEGTGEEELLGAPELSEVAEKEGPIFDFGKLLAGIGGLFRPKNLPWLILLFLAIIIILLILKRRKKKE